jgi:hypothetical protein
LNARENRDNAGQVEKQNTPGWVTGGVKAGLQAIAAATAEDPHF